MPTWTTALPDWDRRIIAGESLLPCGPLFPGEAAECMEVFNELPLVDAMGSPRMGDAAMPWAKNFAEVFFGSYDPDAGKRLITDYLWLVSKKNGKSSQAAGMMVTALIRNWRESGEFGILAPTKEAADNAFKPARDMVKRRPGLAELLQVQDHVRTITHRTTGATLKVVAADSDSVSGKKWIGTFVDELWLFGKRSGAADMLLEATGGMASRDEGFVIYASTQSDDIPAGVFKQKLEYARAVRDGEIEDKAFLPLLYEFPKGMIEREEHREPKNFYITNPNLGVSVSPEFIARRLREAESGEGEETVQSVLAKHLNVQIGLNLRAGRWTGADYWQRGARQSLTLDEIIATSDVLELGIDGGGLDDMLGVCVLGRHEITGAWRAWHRAWVHEIALERRKSEAARYRDFSAAGDLVIISDGSEEDVEAVAAIAGQLRDSGKLDKIGVDAVGIQAIVDALGELDLVPGEHIVAISQGWKLNGAIKNVERKLAAGQLLHGGSALMAWCVGNCKVVQVGNAITITKQASGTAKIDPVMATFNAASLMALAPEANVYGEDSELTVV